MSVTFPTCSKQVMADKKHSSPTVSSNFFDLIKITLTFINHVVITGKRQYRHFKLRNFCRNIHHITEHDIRPQPPSQLAAIDHGIFCTLFKIG